MKTLQNHNFLIFINNTKMSKCDFSQNINKFKKRKEISLGLLVLTTS